MVQISVKDVTISGGRIISKDVTDKQDKRITENALLEGLKENIGISKFANMAIVRKMNADGNFETIEQNVRFIEFGIKQARDVLSACVKKEFRKKVNGNGSERHIMVRDLIDALDLHKETMTSELENAGRNKLEILLALFKEQERMYNEVGDIITKYAPSKAEDSLSSVLFSIFTYVRLKREQTHMAIYANTEVYFKMKDYLQNGTKKIEEKIARKEILESKFKEKSAEVEKLANNQLLSDAKQKVFNIERRLNELSNTRYLMGKDAQSIITVLGNAAGKYDYKKGPKRLDNPENSLLDFVSDITLIIGNEKLFFSKIEELKVMVEKGATKLKLPEGIRLKDEAELKRVRASISVLLGDGESEGERKANVARTQNALVSITHLKKMAIRKAVLENMLDSAKREELLSESDARKARSDAGILGNEIEALDKAVLAMQVEIRRHLLDSFGVQASVTEIQLMGK